MDNWQAWAAGALGLMLTLLTTNYRREKMNADKHIVKFNDHRMEVMERITRLEAEVMTERQAREVWQELLQPFLASLQRIDEKTDIIAHDLTDLKIQVASVDRRREHNE